MAHEEAVKIVDGLLMDIGHSLTESSDAIAGAMSMTNANDFIFDAYKNLNAWFAGRGKIEFSVTMTLTGSQDIEQPFSGDEIEVKITKGKLEDDNGTWKTISIEIGSAKVVDWSS